MIEDEVSRLGNFSCCGASGDDTVVSGLGKDAIDRFAPCKINTEAMVADVGSLRVVVNVDQTK